MPNFFRPGFPTPPTRGVVAPPAELWADPSPPFPPFVTPLSAL